MITQAIRDYLSNIWRALYSIWEGMAVTLSYMYRKPTTVQYPDRLAKPVEQQLPERYRGILEADVGLCTACLACSRACPIDCFDVEVSRDPQTKERAIVRFNIDVGKCMYCGLCAESCPSGAIRHTREFAASNVDVYNLVIDFVDQPVPPYKPKKDEPAPAGAPVGSILRRRLKKWDRPRELAPGARPRPVEVLWNIDGTARPPEECVPLDPEPNKAVGQAAAPPAKKAAAQQAAAPGAVATASAAENPAGGPKEK